MPDANPLKRLMSEWLPVVDFGVYRHGFLAHGRDYELVVSTVGRGTDRVVLTHVVVAEYETAVPPDVWVKSWDDVFLDYDRAKDQDGYIWGTNWSLAYPGLTLLDTDRDAAKWTKLLGRTMYAVSLETDRFKLKLIFADIRTERLSNDAGVIEKVHFPLDSWRRFTPAPPDPPATS